MQIIKQKIYKFIKLQQFCSSTISFQNIAKFAFSFNLNQKKKKNRKNFDLNV